MIKVRLFCAILASAFLPSPTGAAATEPCYTRFYQTKTAACLDSLTDTIPGLKPNPNDPSDHSNAEAVVGFLAVIFADLPQEKARLLHKDGIAAVKSLYVEALYRSGLPQDAKAYAEANGLADIFRRYQDQDLGTIKTVAPNSLPSDNDFLIGAYMASGDVEYIRRILANFTNADEASARDAIRMGLMNGKFGGTLAPPGRDRTMVNELCMKYECKNNLRRFMHVATLASAFWALRSLAQQDQGIHKTYDDFFQGDVRLKNLLVEEQAAFSNYVTLLVAYSAIKDSPNINASLLVYEKLGSAQDAADAMRSKH